MNSWEDTLKDNGSGGNVKVEEISQKLETNLNLQNDADPENNKNSTPSYGEFQASGILQPANNTTGKSINASLLEPDPRPHMNIVFIGHVDAGKSTTCGNILYTCGLVDQRTMEKYEREAKEKNRESWFLAFIMDTNEEERSKGKTVEVGRAAFSLKNRRFTILDAPGHKSFVPNMISGASQADIGVLIISARKGEFETGFERGGQTREHAMLAKTLGVNQLIVAINKMDDPTCMWDKNRYDEIEKKLTPYLKTCGYNPAKDIFFVPISGQLGQNLKFHVSDQSNPKYFDPRASWYSMEKPTLFDILDKYLTVPDRSSGNENNGIIRIPLLDGYRDNGVIAMGKIELGTIRCGDNLVVMPNRVKTKIQSICLGEEMDEYAWSGPGENVRIKLLNIDEDSLSKGFVLCSQNDLCPVVKKFKAQLLLVELLEQRPLVTSGYECIIHCNTSCEEVCIEELLEGVELSTKKKKTRPAFVKSQYMLTCNMSLTNPLCIEEFIKCPQLGRFTLRDEGKTIAVGKVLEILDSV
ncbi:Elongation factor Tu GTP binding domain protein [Cryptosporidium meleagridis]|uniref:Elongation factor Tu GTP binding domain protein n=1 Tax=Cryptosporidium meleagridis TaxID=93969 RepID=A0A2P4Z5D4_9CRYT|nr:Elongation factor Tu GTP binding domain protein [Cryptosporidium meleagridis]